MQTPTAGTQHPGPAAGKQHQSHSRLPCFPSSSPICCRYSRLVLFFFIFILFLLLLSAHNTLQLPDERGPTLRRTTRVCSTRSSLWQLSVHLQTIHCLQITHKKHEFIYYASTQKDHAPRVPSRNAKARDG